MDNEFSTETFRVNYKASWTIWSETNNFANEPIPRNFHGREVTFSIEGKRSYAPRLPRHQ
jgi:hypothetical protein